MSVEGDEEDNTRRHSEQTGSKTSTLIWRDSGDSAGAQDDCGIETC